MLVGLIGRKRSGKDTAAAVLSQEGFGVVKFAEGLKIMLEALFDAVGYSEATTHRMLESDLKETPIPVLGNRTPRYLMQILGTEWGRDLVAKDVWIKVALDRCERFPNAVIADCRFPNEAEAIRSAGGILVRIVRDLCHEDVHSSETFIDSLPTDFAVLNNGTIEDLGRKIKEIVL